MNMMPTLFGTNSCPACGRAKAWLSMHRAYYVFRDVNEPGVADLAAEMAGGASTGAVPLLVVPGAGGGVVEGFQPERYDALLRTSRTLRGDIIHTAFTGRPSGGPALGGLGVMTPAASAGWWALSTASMAASAFHGYKRNNSVGWAVVWGILGGLFPVIVPVIAFAQGYGKRAR